MIQLGNMRLNENNYDFPTVYSRPSHTHFGTQQAPKRSNSQLERPTVMSKRSTRERTDSPMRVYDLYGSQSAQNLSQGSNSRASPDKFGQKLQRSQQNIEQRMKQDFERLQGQVRKWQEKEKKSNELV